MSDVLPVVAPDQQLETLLAVVRNILGLDTLDESTPLIELGVDSISIVEIMLACEAVYQNSTFSDDVIIDQYTTLKDIDDQVKSNYK